jgi:splicing factor 3B subunit 5
MEHLYAKQVGCGHADTTKWEFMTNVQRDSLASHVGHSSRLELFATIENQSSARTRI